MNHRPPGPPSLPDWLAENLISDAVWVLLGAAARNGYHRVRASLQPDHLPPSRDDAQKAALYRARLATPAAVDLNVVRTEHRGAETVITVEGSMIMPSSPSTSR